MSPATAFWPLMTKSHAAAVLTAEVKRGAPLAPMPTQSVGEIGAFCEDCELAFQIWTKRLSAWLVDWKMFR